MQIRTSASLEQLRQADWFANVGGRTSDLVQFVNTWEEALEHAGSEKWESLCLEAANEYRSRLAERGPGRFGFWNDLVREVKQVTVPLVASKTKAVAEMQNLPKRFVDIVQWDILHLCMEAEFADVYPPGFYAAQSYWYLNGHFPCGWDGEFPNGHLIVY